MGVVRRSSTTNSNSTSTRFRSQEDVFSDCDAPEFKDQLLDSSHYPYTSHSPSPFDFFADLPPPLVEIPGPEASVSMSAPDSCFHNSEFLEENGSNLFHARQDCFPFTQATGTAVEDHLNYRSWYDSPSQFSGRFQEHELQDPMVDSAIPSHFVPPIPHQEESLLTMTNNHVFPSELPFFEAANVQPMDENFLEMMEHPPLYVNYLTDTHRTLLGSQVHNEDQGLPKKSYKRNQLSDDDDERPSKRISIEKDEPSSVSCCTTTDTRKSLSSPALNTNLKPRARQGTATDPQSIAARNIQVDLVTMLEKAINYVKFMQLQVQVLTTDEYWPKQDTNKSSSKKNVEAQGLFCWIEN